MELKFTTKEKSVLCKILMRWMDFLISQIKFYKMLGDGYSEMISLLETQFKVVSSIYRKFRGVK